MKVVRLLPRRRAVRPRDHERPRHHRRRHPHRAARAGADGRAPASRLQELAAVMTRLPQVLVNVPDVDKARADEDAVLAAAVAEEEAALGDTGRVLLRPSGTEPLVRVMVEAGTAGAGPAPSPTGSPTSYAPSCRSPEPTQHRPVSAGNSGARRHARPYAHMRGHPGDRPGRRGAGQPALGDRQARRGACRPYDFYLPWETAWTATRPAVTTRVDAARRLRRRRDGRARPARTAGARQPAPRLHRRRQSTRPTSAAGSAGRWTARASTRPAPSAGGC